MKKWELYQWNYPSRKTLEAALAALSRVAHASQPKGDGKGFIR